MYRRILILFLLSTMALILFGACSHKNMVVLVPSPNGSVGSIRVSNPSGFVNIDTANQATIIKSTTTAPTAPLTMEKEEIQTLFGEALAIQSHPPVHFILYFQSNSIHLQPESKTEIQDIAIQIRKQSAQRISVIGHSDTKGDPADNIKLSKRRAVTIKNQLVAKGISEDMINVTSHGENNPLVKTADNVENAKNRRVEVVIY